MWGCGDAGHGQRQNGRTVAVSPGRPAPNLEGAEGGGRPVEVERGRTAVGCGKERSLLEDGMMVGRDTAQLRDGREPGAEHRAPLSTYAAGRCHERRAGPVVDVGEHPLPSDLGQLRPVSSRGGQLGRRGRPGWRGLRRGR